MRSKGPGDAAIIAACLAGALLLSVLSGYVRGGWTPGALFPFTPLGLLLRFDPRSLAYENACSFGWTFGPFFDYFKVFLITCLLELPFYFWVFRGSPWPARLSSLTLANFCTHPLVFFAFPCLFRFYLTGALASEAFAIGAEGLLVALWASRLGLPPGSAVAAAGLANLFSWQVGIYL